MTRIFKIIIPIILCICALVGCNADDNIVITDKPRIDIATDSLSPTQAIEIEELTRGSLNIVRHLERDDSSIKEWEQLFTDKFDIDIKFLNYRETALHDKGRILNEPPSFIFPADSTKEILSVIESTDGLYLISINDYLRLYDKKELYLKPFSDLNISANLDQRITENLHDNSSELWCMPREIIEPYLYVRRYNEEAMSKLDKPAPNTITELVDMLSEVKKQGLSEYTLPLPNYQSISYFLSDIFSAFDINSNLHPIKYDSDVNGFIDPFVSEKMKNCIEFLASLADDGLIQFDIPSSDVRSEKTFSDISIYKGSKHFSIMLQNDLFDYDSHYYYSPVTYVYVLAKNTEDTVSVEKFIESVYNSESGYLSARYGSDEDYKLDGNQVYPHDTQKVLPSLVGSLPSMDYYTIYSQDKVDTLNTTYKLLREYTASGYFVQIPIKSMAYTDIEYMNGDEVGLAFKKMLYTYLSSEKRPPIDEFLANYITKATASHIVEDINNLNRKNNTGFVFSY